MKTITIGRETDNTIVIDDPSVSRYHCRIDDNGNGTYLLQDLGSSNGTFVNGQIIYGSVELQSTDIVKIGSTVLPWLNYFNENSDIVEIETGTTPSFDPATTTAPPMETQEETEEQPVGEKPGNFLTWSILCTIFCCWPLGIPAIVNSARVNRLWDNGDYEGAREAAHQARVYFWWSFALGIVASILGFLYGYYSEAPSHYYYY